MKTNNETKCKNEFTFLTILQLMLIMFALPQAAFPASVVLDWDPSTDADLAGYKVYYQANSSALPFHGIGATEGSAPIDAANTLTATVSGLDPATNHFFAVTAYNSAGVESVYSNIIEIPESVPPTVAFASPANNASVTGAVSISATASDNKGVASVSFYLNGVLQETDSAAPYGFSWDTSALGSGLYTISAKALDTAGNVGESEIIVTVTGDTTAPTVAMIDPGSIASVSGNVAITANASDNVGVTKIEIYDNGTLAFATNQNPASYNWNSALEDNGSHILSAKAYDAAGNIGTSANVVVAVANDFSAPSVALSSPINDSTIGGLVNLSAHAIDDIGVTRVEFYGNGTLLASATGNPFSFNWDTRAAANGQYTVIAKAYDAAGKVGESTGVTVLVFNDTTAPVVSIGSPIADSTVGGTVAVSASASDNVAVAKVEFFLNGALKASSTSAPYSFSWDTLSFVNGAYTLTAKAYDAAGNTGNSANVVVNVFNDRIAPTVSIVSPVADSTNGGSITVSANATDDVAVSKVEFYVNGALMATTSLAPYGFIWNTALVPNGAFALSAKAYDAAGNMGQAANIIVNVFNDTTVPVVSIVSPANYSTVAGPVSVQAVASDNVAVTKVEFYVNGALQATSINAPFGFTWTTGTLANGAYTLSAKAYDAAGNVGNSTGITANVFYDRSAPTIIAFSMPSAKNSTTVSVLSLSAADNVAVTGYLITESASAPSASASGWSAIRSTSFTFAGTGARTAYAWTKDAAGNVSAGAAAAVLIDTTLPIISSMTLSSGSSGVTANASATDNVGVTKMELYLNNVLQLQTTASSLSYLCQLSSPGSNNLTVKVYDAAGNIRSGSLKITKY